MRALAQDFASHGKSQEWVDYAERYARTDEQNSWVEIYRANRRDGSEFVDEEIRFTILLADAVRELDEEAVAAFESRFDGTVGRLEPALEAAETVMRNVWEEVDPETAKAIMIRSVNRGGLVNTGMANVYGEAPFMDDVLNGMVRSSKYWTNNYFNRMVMPSMRSAVDKLVTGDQLDAARLFNVTRELLAARLDSVPYWRLVANQAASRAYHYGAFRAASYGGYASYRIVTIPDDRRSDICKNMEGRQFQVKDGAAHMEMVANADEAQIASVDPWVTLPEVEGMDSAALADRGVLTPPFHPNCRSTIVLVRS